MNRLKYDDLDDFHFLIVAQKVFTFIKSAKCWIRPLEILKLTASFS